MVFPKISMSMVLYPDNNRHVLIENMYFFFLLLSTRLLFHCPSALVEKHYLESALYCNVLHDTPEAYSEFSQAPTVDFFAKIVIS